MLWEYNPHLEHHWWTVYNLIWDDYSSVFRGDGHPCVIIFLFGHHNERGWFNQSGPMYGSKSMKCIKMRHNIYIYIYIYIHMYRCDKHPSTRFTLRAIQQGIPWPGNGQHMSRRLTCFPELFKVGSVSNKFDQFEFWKKSSIILQISVLNRLTSFDHFWPIAAVQKGFEKVEPGHSSSTGETLRFWLCWRELPGGGSVGWFFFHAAGQVPSVWVWLGSGKDPLSDWWFQTCSIFHNVWDNPSHWRTHIFQDGSNHQPVMFVAVSYSLNSCLISQLRIIWAYCVCVLPSLDPSMPKHEVLRSEHCCLVGFLHMNGLFSNFCPWMDYFPFFFTWMDYCP